MRNIFRLLTAAAATVFMVSAASAEIGAYPAAGSSADRTVAIPVGHHGGGFGGGGFRGGGFKGFKGGGVKGFKGGHFGKGLGGRGHGMRGHGARGHGIKGHGGRRSAGHPRHHMGSAGKGAAGHHPVRAGTIAAHHGLNHFGLGKNRSALVGHHFKKPGGHLHGRLAKLHNHHWRSHYRHVVIVGVIGGVAVCDLYCEFDVPVDVYPEFIAAVDEARAAELEAEEMKADDEAFAKANLTPEDALAQRVEQEQGWNRAVAILEEAAAQEDQQAAEAQKAGKDVAAIIEQPDEQVDVVMDEDGAKDGAKKG